MAKEIRFQPILVLTAQRAAAECEIELELAEKMLEDRELLEALARSASAAMSEIILETLRTCVAARLN